MSYVNGFVIAVKKDRIDEYTRLSEKMLKTCVEKGALEYVETVGDGLTEGNVTSFMRAVQCQDDEVVVFSWITYPSKEISDAVNEAMMNDPEMQGWEDMPFDGKRMIFGGFNPIVEWRKGA